MTSQRNQFLQFPYLRTQVQPIVYVMLCAIHIYCSKNGTSETVYLKCKTIMVMSMNDYTKKDSLQFLQMTVS